MDGRQGLVFSLAHNLLPGVFSLVPELRQRWVYQVSAEHMGFGKLSGNFIDIATANTKEVLRSIDNPPLDILRAIGQAELLGQILVKPLKKSSSMRRVTEHVCHIVEKLNKDEIVIVPCCTADHSMLLFIQCTDVCADAKKMFRIVHYNTGLGVARYHHVHLRACSKSPNDCFLDLFLHKLRPILG